MTFPPSAPLRALLDAPMRPGRLVWIGVRPARREPMRVLPSARLEAGRGIVGDRYARPGARQVTLVAEESLAAVASFLGRETVPPEALRRNLVVRGLNLVALKARRLRVGSAVLECVGECHPCSFLETSLGVGGYNAARGLGGITARVAESGEATVGDLVERLDDP